MQLWSYMADIIGIFLGNQLLAKMVTRLQGEFEVLAVGLYEVLTSTVAPWTTDSSQHNPPL